MKGGQAALDMVVLIGIILFLVIPFTVSVFHGFSGLKESSAMSNIEAVKDAIVMLQTLGPSSTTKVVLDIPRGYMLTVRDSNILSVSSSDGREVVTEERMPVKDIVGGAESGIHSSRIHYDGKSVFIGYCVSDSECETNLCNKICMPCGNDSDCKGGGSQCRGGICMPLPEPVNS